MRPKDDILSISYLFIQLCENNVFVRIFQENAFCTRLFENLLPIYCYKNVYFVSEIIDSLAITISHNPTTNDNDKMDFNDHTMIEI